DGPLKYRACDWNRCSSTHRLLDMGLGSERSEISSRGRSLSTLGRSESREIRPSDAWSRSASSKTKGYFDIRPCRALLWHARIPVAPSLNERVSCYISRCRKE